MEYADCGHGGRRATRRAGPPGSAEAARGLRDQALTLDAATVGLSPAPDHPLVWGVVMETCYPQAVATLVAFADGTTSLYFSSGGGIIGAGEHASVRATLPPLLAASEALMGAFSPAAAFHLPEQGRVRFYLRTFGGTLTADADGQELARKTHALSPVFFAAHAVIAAVRETANG